MRNPPLRPWWINPHHLAYLGVASGRGTKPILEQADVAAVGHLEGIVSKRLGSRYRSGRPPGWFKFKNPEAPAVKREAEADWGRP
jgi:ATP-dependent DNA ligase